MEKPVFYLLPTPIKPGGWETIPDYAIQIYHKIDYFIAENAKTARRFLSEINHPLPQSEITVHNFDKNSGSKDADEYMQPLTQGRSIAYLSEAGSPAIADPGNQLVLWAHRHKVKVKVIPGPISLMLALAGSGLNGQNFHFHGYLPVKSHAFARKIELLQEDSVKRGTTHIFIETPYRAEKTFGELLKVLHPDINLCVARDLTLDAELVLTMPVRDWKKEKTKILAEKPLCVFLFAAAGAGIN